MGAIDLVAHVHRCAPVLPSRDLRQSEIRHVNWGEPTARIARSTGTHTSYFVLAYEVLPYWKSILLLMKLEMTSGTVVSKPTTSSMPASFGSAIENPFDVIATTTSFAAMPIRSR